MHDRTIDLGRIDRCNAISRQVAAGKLSAEDALKRLKGACAFMDCRYKLLAEKGYRNAQEAGWSREHGAELSGGGVRAGQAVDDGEEGVEAAAKQLEKCVRQEAKDISDKYIKPPRTTDFGVLYVPIEGLYAEIMRRDVLYPDEPAPVGKLLNGGV